MHLHDVHLAFTGIFLKNRDFQQWEQAGISEEHVKKRAPGCNLAPLNEQLQGENPGKYSWSRFPW